MYHPKPTWLSAAALALTCAPVRAQWVRHFDNTDLQDRGVAVAVDSNRNVYSLGTAALSSSNTDVLIVKYDPAGNKLWSKRTGGTANSTDQAVAITTDKYGNVYVTGNTIGLNAQGQPRQDTDIFVAKYRSTGARVWRAVFNGLYSGVDTAAGIGVDGHGSVYVEGYTTDPDQVDIDGVTLKYDATGHRQWTKRIHSPNGNWFPAGIAVDSAGNSYIAGEQTDINGNLNVVTAQVDTNGVSVWLHTFPGNDLGDTRPTAIRIDSVSNVYIAGVTPDAGALNVTDALVLKYNHHGRLVFARSFGPTLGGGTSEQGVAVAPDSTGDAYMAGIETTAGGNRYLLVKYDPLGKLLWKAEYPGASSTTGNDNLAALSVDSQGNAIVTGTAPGTTGGHAVLTAKYDAKGHHLWSHRFTGSVADANNAGADVAVDSMGNIDVVGTVQDRASQKGVLTIQYAP